MMREWRYGLWLLMAGGAGACDRCSWRLEYVEVADASGDSSGGVMAASSGAELTRGSTAGTSAGSAGGETVSSGWTMGTSSGSGGTSATGTSGADDIAIPPPGCGDGVIDPGEECDDGNAVDEDECSDDCWAPRIVFITGGVYTGDLDGIDGADDKCSLAAAGAKLPGAFKAWISGSDGSAPKKRFGSAGFRGWYKRPDGKNLVRGWDGLISGVELANSISVTEKNDPVLPVDIYVWSNTTSDGLHALGGDCLLWASTSAVFGGVGRFSAKDAAWTESTSQFCKSEAHLYCFQVG